MIDTLSPESILIQLLPGFTFLTSLPFEYNDQPASTLVLVSNNWLPFTASVDVSVNAPAATLVSLTASWPVPPRVTEVLPSLSYRTAFVSSTSKSFKSAEIVIPLPSSFLVMDTFSPESIFTKLLPGFTFLTSLPFEYNDQPASTLVVKFVTFWFVAYNWLPFTASVESSFILPAATLVIVLSLPSLPTLTVPIGFAPAYPAVFTAPLATEPLPIATSLLLFACAL